MTSGLHVIQTVASIAERSGGPARTVRGLCEALASAGARVSLVAGHDPERDDALLPPDPALVGLTLVPIRRRLGLPHFDFTAAIAPLLRTGEATILHDNGIWSPANIAAGAAARRLALPMFITPHGMLEPWAMAWHARRKRIAWILYQRRLLERASGLVVTAPSEAVGVRARVPRVPVAVIPNGVDCPKTVPDRTGRDTAATQTVLYLSRIHPKKNLPGLIEAWSRIAARPDFAAWTLVIAGPDEQDHARELAQLIARLGIGGRVRLNGPVAEADKAAALAAADIVVLPSHSENFGIIVAEALAHGVPVIASTGTPWASLVTEGCGWYVDPAPAALAAALAEAMGLDPAQRRAMGVRGHALVRRDFGWDGIARQTLGFYDRLRHDRPKQDPVDA